MAHRRGRGRACPGVRAGRIPPPRVLHGRPADALPSLPQRARPARLRRRVRRRRAERLPRVLGARSARLQRPARELGIRRALRQRHHPGQRAALHQPRRPRTRGVGWAAANSVLWNSEATDVEVQSPPGAVNQAYGCKGLVAGDGVVWDPRTMPYRDFYRGVAGGASKPLPCAARGAARTVGRSGH